MSVLYAFSVILLNFLNLVNAKTCLRSDNIYETFTCGIYEYCCGTRCCRSPIITFYQMWYFWLMVFLTILFCSGGGWWYRLRNQDTYITPSMPSRVSNTRPVIQPACGPVYASSVPMPPTSHVTHHATAAPQVAQYPPPPPYCGPPPSYDAVVNQNPSQNANLNQNLNQNHNQNRTPQQN